MSEDTKKQELPEIGDTVDVTYVSGAPIRGTVVEIFPMSEEGAERAREFYPDIKAGEKIYKVDVYGETRNFLLHQTKLISRKGTPVSQTENITKTRLENLKSQPRAKITFKK